MDSGAATTGNAAQEQSQQVGRGLTRMPAVTPRLPGPKGVNFQQFCDQLWTDLPGDHHGRGSFDTSASFVVGDPGARFGSAAPLEYEVTEEIGRPHWELIFEHVRRHCGYLIEFHTVYVMVDNRDLANHKRQDSSLPHWPAAARWWHSRLKLMGPHKEKTELLLFPNSESTGLHHVHPTWAGTFVLAALVAMFPGINFILLDRRRRMANRVLRLLADLHIDRCAGECLNTLPIPWKPNQEASQLRYVFGCAMEGSDLPCYIVWPTRTAEQSFWCIDAWKGDWVRLDKCGYMAPMGIEHFFDAFCLDPQRPWRTMACHALGIPSCHVSEDTHLETIHANKFSLTPRRIPVERKTAAKQEVDQEMVAREEGKSDADSDAESGWSGVSDNSSTDSECTDVEASSVASDLDRFDTAYDAFRDLANGLYRIDLRRYSRGVTSEDAAVFCWLMATRSCRSWCIFRELGLWGG